MDKTSQLRMWKKSRFVDIKDLGERRKKKNSTMKSHRWQPSLIRDFPAKKEEGKGNKNKKGTLRRWKRRRNVSSTRARHVPGR